MKNVSLKLFALLLLLSLTGHTQTWTAMTLPEIAGNYTLTGISFPGPDNGWAAGFIYRTGFFDADVKGLIMHYTDGKWSLADSPSPSDQWDLKGIWFLNDHHGWAFGQDKSKSSGLLLHYNRGVWEIVNLGFVTLKEWVLYDVFFFNENEGYAAGSSWGNDKPVLLHFHDGKWNIEDVADFKKQTLLAVNGVSPDKVYTGGFREGEFGKTGISRALGSYIISGSTGTWEQAKLPLLAKNIICRDISCLSESHIFAVGWMPAFQNAPETGKILHFNGSKWSEIDAGVDAKEWNLMGIAFENAEKGWAAGNYPARNKGLLIEYNKGKWIVPGKKTEPQVSDKWILYGICSDKQGNFYAVGSDQAANKGIILKLNK